MMKVIAASIVKKLVDSGHIAYFAGGWVRDLLLGHPSDDIDIATTASVEEVQRLFPKTVPVGVAFGIVIVVQDNHQFEVATFRKDRDYADGRRPTGIDPAAPEEDALRRDFTINGMFYNPLTDELLDYVGGREDLKKEIVRAIGIPRERFEEDRLRMMRAVRYATRFGFTIESKTQEAIREQASKLFPSVATERVWQEFKKMALFGSFGKGLVMLHELGLLPTIFHELQSATTGEIERRVRHISQFPKGAPPIAELLELFPSHQLEQRLKICDFFKLSNEERGFVLSLARAEKMTHGEPYDWVQLYADPNSEVALEVIAARMEKKEAEPFLIQHARRRELLAAAIKRCRLKAPLVRAERLKEEGIAPGKKMGGLLAEAERIAVNEGLDDVDAVVNRLKQLPMWSEQ